MFDRRMMYGLSFLLLATTASAQLTNNIFQPSSGIWDSDDNWSLGHTPMTSERAVINQGQTCTVDDDPNPENTAGAVDVHGTLTVSSTGRLADKGDMTVFHNSSGANGVLTMAHLLEVDGELKVEDGASATIRAYPNNPFPPMIVVGKVARERRLRDGRIKDRGTVSGF